jgi:hypothetical protein
MHATKKTPRDGMTWLVVVVGEVYLCCLMACVSLRARGAHTFVFDPPGDLHQLLQQFLRTEHAGMLVVDGNVGFDARALDDAAQTRVAIVPAGVRLDHPPRGAMQTARGAVFVPRRCAEELATLDARALDGRLCRASALPDEFVTSVMVEHAFEGRVGARDLRRFR